MGLERCNAYRLSTTNSLLQPLHVFNLSGYRTTPPDFTIGDRSKLAVHQHCCSMEGKLLESSSTEQKAVDPKFRFSLQIRIIDIAPTVKTILAQTLYFLYELHAVQNRNKQKNNRNSSWLSIPELLIVNKQKIRPYTKSRQSTSPISIQIGKPLPPWQMQRALPKNFHKVSSHCISTFAGEAEGGRRCPNVSYDCILSNSSNV